MISSIVLFVILIVIILSATILLFRLRPIVITERRMKGYYTMSVVAIGWMVASAAALMAAPETFAFIYVIRVAFIRVVPYLTFWFVLNFTESDLIRSRKMKIFLIAAASIDVLALITNPIHNLYFGPLISPSIAGAYPETRLLFWLTLLILTITLFCMYSILFRYINKNLKRYPVLIITGFGAILPFFLNMLYTLRVPGFLNDYSPIGYFLTIMLFAYFSYLANVRNFSPTLFRDTIAKITRDPTLYAGVFRDAARMIAKEGCTALGVQCIGVWMFSNDRNTLINVLSHDTRSSKSTVQRSISLWECDLYKELLESEQLFIVDDIRSKNALSSSIRDYTGGLCAYIDAPVRIGGELYGIIRVEQHHSQAYPERREWTLKEQDFIFSLANFASVALENTERHRLKTAIEAANKRTLLMLNTSPLSTKLWDKDLNVIAFNKAVVNLYGLDDDTVFVDDFINKCSPEYQPDGQRSEEKAAQIIRKAFEEGYVKTDWMHRYIADNSPLPAEITLVRAQYGDEDVVISYTRDLREHNKLMDEINQRGKMLMAVNQAAETLLRTKDDDNVVVNLKISMELLGRANNFDRVQIWKNDYDNGVLYHECIHIWCSEAVKDTEESIRNVRFSLDRNHHLIELLAENECFSGPISDFSEEEQALINDLSYKKSLVVIPLFLDDEFWGFFSADDCFNDRVFTDDEISILRSVCLMMVNTINRHELIAKRTQEAQARTIKKYEYAAKMKDALAEITKSPALSSGNLKVSAGFIVKAVQDVLNVSSVEYWHYNPDENALINMVSYDSSSGFNYSAEYYDLNSRKKYADMLWTERLIVMNSIEEIEKNFQFMQERNNTLTALLDAPILSEGKLVGLICILQIKDKVYSEGRRWAIEEQNFASSAADLMALAISNYERQKAYDEAELANRAKSIFLAKMSHEIRTPMNAILGMTELALREEMSETIKEHILTAKQAGANLLTLINDILDFSKIESGAMQIIPSEYSLSSLLNDVVSIIRIRAFDSQIRFAVNIDSNIPNALIGDELRVRQVIINILGNAVKFTDKGYVLFSVSGENTGENTVRLSMKVEDSGRGIKKEDISKLFSDYFQIDESGNEIEGTGLGLAISQNIMHAMNGEITVESEYGKGSIFTVTFEQEIHSHERIAQVENPEQYSVLLYERRYVYTKSIADALENLGVKFVSVSDENEFFRLLKNNFTFIFVSLVLFEKNKNTIAEMSGNSKILLLSEFGESIPPGNWSTLSIPAHAISIASILNNVTDAFSYNYSEKLAARFTAPDANILVVDDINTNLRVVKGLLLPYEMNVDLCVNGYDAIEAVKEKRYDLIFMDHRMPGIDGVETTKRIRDLGEEDSYYLKVPIVALTANAVSGMKEMFLSSGFNEFMSKPIDLTVLNMVIEAFIPKEKRKAYVGKRESEKSNEVPFEIEGLDVDKGILRTGGTLDYYYETLEIFYAEGQKHADEIIELLESNNMPLYTTNVHALKSATANIGGGDISDMAYALEMAAINGDMEFIKANTSIFADTLKRLLENIKNALSEYNSRNKEEGDYIESEVLKELLTHLKTSLESYDIEGINQDIDKLRHARLPEEIAAAAGQISQHTLVVEYDEAIEIIDGILAGN
ncbi:MAG: ATP-binding protein [Oscillospiraceae bacterium]|nr:ATP-binding protein [Oscillospiraceae bacterium]